MQNLTVQELIDAGVHFGCRVSRWNPKMAPYIQGRRNLIHIIDLRETLRGLLRAQNFLFHLASEGQQIMWVGTKRQVKGIIGDVGQRTTMPAVTERWIGGTLTNFSVIRSRLRRLEELESQEESQAELRTKKEMSSLRRERRKIFRNLGGIRDLTGIPGAMVVVDPLREANAVKEARKMGVAVIGLLDTDCDPTLVDIAIPGNDDALKSVRLLIERMAMSVEEGVANHRERLAAMGSAERTEDTGTGDEPRPTRGNQRNRRPNTPPGQMPSSGSVATAPDGDPARPAAASASGEAQA
jgi:small subunit ribosomal protein S2